MSEWQEHQIRDEYEDATADELNRELCEIGNRIDSGETVDEDGVDLGEKVCLIENIMFSAIA